MQPLQLLATLRAIANHTLSECNRQEYKPEFIYKEHNQKLSNLQKSVNSNSTLNAKSKAKLNAEIKKLILAPTKNKAYDLIKSEVNAGLSRLSSAIEFMKR